MLKNKFEPVESDGDKRKKGFSDSVPKWLWVVIALVVYAAATSGPDKPEKKPVVKQTIVKSWKEEDNSFSALYYVQHYYIEPRLKAPSTAKFAGLHDDGTKVVKNGVSYEIASYVDSQNSFGAMLRKYYIAKVTQGGENLWRVDAFSWIE